jgi:hypothetical protein
MRVLIALFLVSLTALSAMADAAPRPYGEKLSSAEVVPVSVLLETPADFVGKTIKIEGRITGVCEHRGCWMELAGDKDYQTMRVKVEDGVIVFPADAVGHMATAEGVFTRIDISPEQATAMHKAECTKDDKECSHGPVTEAGVIYQIAGNGALID